ncbi:hypothetical protein BRD05_07890 [Halobacteriales archaeon QS_9_70_65]|nr:MAG: hypothetical protein BRD05_07890 [Halobacteriales archaeon QS_9_70_65]
MRTAPGVDEVDRVCGPAEHVVGGFRVVGLADDFLAGIRVVPRPSRPTVNSPPMSKVSTGFGSGENVELRTGRYRV